MKRRHFFQTLAAGSILAPSMPTWALESGANYQKNIGLQLYTLRNQLKTDTVGTIKAIADAGYDQVEPYGFPGGASDMIQAAKDHGLAINSSHFDWESVTDPEKEGVAPFEDILATAKDAGLSHLVIPYLHGHNRETLDDYKVIAERCNVAAEKAKAAGIQLSYHNHAFEFEPKGDDGMTGYDVFAAEFSDDMKFEVDVFWVKVGGVEIIPLLKKLDGRVAQLHLKDLKTEIELPNFGSVPKDAFEEIGDGQIAMAPILAAAAEIGVAHCHVEQDQSPDPIASVTQSLGFLESL